MGRTCDPSSQVTIWKLQWNLNFVPIQKGCWENLIMFCFGYWALTLDCDSAVSVQNKEKCLAMFCLYTLPLTRPAQAKTQMLTTSSWIVTMLLKPILKSFGLHSVNIIISCNVFLTFSFSVMHYNDQQPGRNLSSTPALPTDLAS